MVHGSTARWLVTAVLVLGTAASVGACSSPGSLRTADVEKSLVDGFTQQVGGRFTATCPSSIPAQAGQTVSCTVTDDSAGATVAVAVTVEGEDGSFSWKAGAVNATTSSSSATG